MAMPGMGMMMDMGRHGMGMGSYMSPFGYDPMLLYSPSYEGMMYMPWYSFPSLGNFMSSSLVDGTSTIMIDGQVIQSSPATGTKVYSIGPKSSRAKTY